jgi:hypothetical protein
MNTSSTRAILSNVHNSDTAIIGPYNNTQEAALSRPRHFLAHNILFETIKTWPLCPFPALSTPFPSAKQTQQWQLSLIDTEGYVS